MSDQITLSAEEQAEIDRNATIAEQNDRFRTTWGADFTVSGRIVMTRSLAALSGSAQAAIMQAVMKFDTFTEDNDPHGDHSFGAFEVEDAGESIGLFWKIDLYDLDFIYGSETPDDPEQTRRVLTIMRRSEW